MEKKYALVTGASAGLGSEFARQLAEQGYNLVLTARREDRLKKLKAEILKSGDVKVEVIRADLSKLSDIKKLVSEIKNKKITIDFLVNNAGFGSYGEFINSDFSELENMIDVNVNALVYLTHEYLPQMKKRNSGNILFVASVGAFMPVPLLSVYGATKAFVLSLGEAVAEEINGSKINVTILCPGPTSTEFFNVASYGNDASQRKSYSDPADVVHQGLEGIKSGKRIVVPGLKSKIQVLSTRLFSRKLITKFTHQVIKKMK